MVPAMAINGLFSNGGWPWFLLKQLILDLRKL